MVGGFALVTYPLGLQLSRPATATPGVAHPGPQESRILI